MCYVFDLVSFSIIGRLRNCDFDDGLMRWWPNFSPILSGQRNELGTMTINTLPWRFMWNAWLVTIEYLILLAILIIHLIEIHDFKIKLGKFFT